MKELEYAPNYFCIPNPGPGAAGRLRQTVGLSIIFCIWDSEPNVSILQNVPANPLYMVRSTTYCP
jgi:hypothetical protein